MRHTVQRKKHIHHKNQTHKKSKAWGYHLMIDATNCDPVAIRSKKTIDKFARKLVKEIHMVPYGPPRINRFGKGKLEGNTLVQLIQTSDITAHFDEEHNNAYIDVFSCKTFPPKIAIKVFDEFFKPEKKHIRFFKRQA